MKCYRISKKVKKEYSWVYINIPSKIQDLLLDFGKEIDPDDLYKKEADDGIETEPHITVKYALKTDDFKDIKEILDNKKGGKFYLGESSVFETDKYDVVKIEVESDNLKEIHEELNKLPHEDKYPEYQAHATIAYLKKGKGKKYEGKFKVNKSFKFDELFFGDKERKDHKIKLSNNKNSNWYKTAQEENYYTTEIAQNTKDPEILKKILEKGNDDIVSYYAADNENCPPETLTGILKRGKNDLVSQWAAINPNCPPEVLSDVLKRGNDDEVSQIAALNKNCPPEALVDVLKRGKNDEVSRFAARNENCPPEALSNVLKRGKNDEVSRNAAENENCPPLDKIKWMRATGKIGKEDPTKHIIEYEEERLDEDLEKLKKMISKNSNWYKTALIVEKGDSGKVAYPVCAWCGKFGTTPSGKEETGKYIWKEISELNPEEKKQYDKFKWAYDLMKAGKLNLNDPIGFTHGICPSCAQQAY